jgi:hypothetical protein
MLMGPEVAPQTPPPTSLQRGEVDLLLAMHGIADGKSGEGTPDHGGTQSLTWRSRRPPSQGEGTFAVRRKDVLLIGDNT